MASILPLGYLGPEASNAHQAAQNFLNRLDLAEGHAQSLVPYPTIAQLFKAVASGQLPSAVIPVENGIQGSVTEVLEAMMTSDTPFQVLADFVLPIRHTLIHKASSPDLTQIKTVLSHPQALGQCREALTTLLGDEIEFRFTSSTSEAVRQLTELDASNMAVGTELAAQTYNANVINKNISDTDNNQTRFMWVTNAEKASEVSTATAELFKVLSKALPQKTTICIGMKDRPGCLVDMLLVLKAYGVNMTRIESRPSKQKLGQYYFYIDVDCDLTQPKYERVAMYLNVDSVYLRQLGPYYCLGELNAELKSG